MKNVLYDNMLCQINQKPFKYTEYKLFSDNLCKELIDNFKDILYLLKQDNKLSSSRFKINLKGNTIDGYYNSEILEKLNKIEPLNSILNEYKTNIPKLLYKKYNKGPPKRKIEFDVMLVYDTKNYEIGPHTDSYIRNSTLVTYLGESNENLGLYIYKDKINRHKDIWNKTHYDFNNFTKVKQISYYPGSSVDFKVSSNSFHGVPRINLDCERFSIQYYILN
jgi:hypothetical protein